jgi:hypothetical protein
VYRLALAGLTLATAMASARTLAGCGANIQAVYEGDLGFEHCIALDADPSVTAGIQRACWTEWLAFYTYGQTRDRVRHAELRIRSLSETDVVPIEAVVQAAPEPLAAPAPETMASGPPIVEHAPDDAGAPDAAPSATVSREACMRRCTDIRDECRAQCRDRSCERGCGAGFAGCAEGCPR